MPAESTSPRGRSLGLLAVLGATAFWSFGGVLGKASGVGILPTFMIAGPVMILLSGITIILPTRKW